MDVPTFGESIYKLIQEHDEANKDTGVQLIRDLNIAGLTSTGAGKIAFPYQWTKAARSFAAWFSEKFFANDNTSSIIFDNSMLLSLSSTNSYGTLNYPDSVTITKSNKFITFEIELDTPGRYVCSKISDLPSGGNPLIYQVDILTPSRSHVDPSNISEINRTYWNMNNDANSATTIWDLTESDFSDGSLLLRMVVASASDPYWGYINPGVYSLQQVCSFVRAGDATLTAEKPQEVHYPEVAEDGSQVYEVTYQGVTATDIEGIIQGAVDQILAGTAAIAGEVTQAQEVPADPEVPPELDGLDLPALGAALTSRFPFSIPWDVARGIGLLAAPAEAPYWEVDFLAPISYRVGGWEGSTTVVLDFSEFEIIGRLCRWTSTIGFCLMLAAGTKRLIWVA